jgi:hypothetical protein
MNLYLLLDIYSLVLEHCPLLKKTTRRDFRPLCENVNTIALLFKFGSRMHGYIALAIF